MVQNESNQDLQILRPKEQALLLGVSLVTLWRMREDLPPSVAITQRIRGRRRSDLAAWIEQRSAR